MEKNVKINKLFLVGNGLDLALGLKTSYADFMFWLLKKQLLEATKNFGIQKAPKPYRGGYVEFFDHHEPLIIYGFSSNDLFDVLFKENYSQIPEKIEVSSNLKDLLEVITTYQISVNPKLDRFLFSNIYDQCELGWVDIEETYFELIQKIITDYAKSNISELIESLNYELQLISNELLNYLSEIDLKIEKNVSDKFIGKFLDEIDPDEIISSSISSDSYEVDKYYFLNFNYTRSIKNIISSNRKFSEKCIINPIHGNLDDHESIIFGYGDEMHEYYKTLENLRDNKFFKHIKSFRYFQNKNYRNLLRFLNSKPFQVCVYGHSCEISDRVMLNEIFEHENCISIKVYFYKDEKGSTDFTNKTMNISRHFNSNKLMREKIVEFNPENEIPQINS